MLCRNCSQPIVPIERYTEAGLDYCKDPECIYLCGEKITGVAVVMLHKQGFNVIPIEDARGKNFMDVHGRSF
jgi:hypothetical protein